MKRSFSLILLACTLALTACGTTEGLVAGLGVVGTALGAISKDADYEEYAKRCKEIIIAQAELQKADNELLLVVAKTKPSEALLYKALTVSKSGIQQCALAVPQGFFKSLVANGNLLNFFATVYGINRSDSQAQRQMQNSKELGLAQMNQEVQMEALRGELIKTFGANSVSSFNAGAAAARQPVIAE